MILIFWYFKKYILKISYITYLNRWLTHSTGRSKQTIEADREKKKREGTLKQPPQMTTMKPVTDGVGMHANETLPGQGQQDRDEPPASETQSADGPAEKPGFSAQTPISTFNRWPISWYHRQVLYLFCFSLDRLSFEWRLIFFGSKFLSHFIQSCGKLILHKRNLKN
jgi:hypothetical protein